MDEKTMVNDVLESTKASLSSYQTAISQYALLVFAPMQLLSSISIMVQPGLVALSRIGELLKLETEDQVSGDRKIGEIENISFSDVSFAYTDKPVIHNFNLEAQKMEVGSGKKDQQQMGGQKPKKHKSNDMSL